ncbi:DExH-box splicing factor binding site-domain-containing protein [Aspergillus leporis]|uniref:Pre-mRNA-splicing factor n=1 Tax=Aspergillus leporis TaxID=41062 RepID=A0A5N5WPQ3_9EURO|nr:DExH-box splicing factor binding site-domain-containing protein [Aspergillus leporis]
MSSSQPPRDERSKSSSTKPFSLSIGGGSSASNGQPKKSSFNLQSSSRTLARRPHHLHDDESDEEERAPVHEAVTEFDTLTGTAVSADKKNEKQELVIPVASNNNWRDRPGINARRPKGKNLLPKEVQAIQEAAKRGETAGNNVETEGPSMSYGLSFAQQRGSEQQANGDMHDAPMKDAQPVREEERKPLTQDEIALRALISESKGETEARSDLVIESRQADEEAGGALARYDETTSFRADITSRPESATLDQYNAIPVEEFGAALLRGMGWKEGQAVGKGKYGSSGAVDKPRIPERRPGFLGIGAKDASGAKGAEMELGAWGKAAMRKGARKSGGKEGGTSTEGVYMPIMMQNTKTGEFITEEELSVLQKEAKSSKGDDWKERRDRNLEKSGRDKDRDRDYRRREDHDSDRHDRRRTGSSRRDRSHSRRRRYDDDDGDSKSDRYYRDRDRDRERRRDRDGDRSRERDKNRERSRRYRDDDRYSSRHSSNTSSRHGRDRDRDLDRDSDRGSRMRRTHDDR